MLGVEYVSGVWRDRRVSCDRGTAMARGWSDAMSTEQIVRLCRSPQRGNDGQGRNIESAVVNQMEGSAGSLEAWINSCFAR